MRLLDYAAAPAHGSERGNPLDRDANIRSLPEFSFTLTEHDAARPWIVARSEHRTVDLPDGQDFGEWARAEYPRERYTVQLDPSLEPWSKGPA